MAEPNRDRLLLVLRVVALLIGLRAVTNLGKPFGTGSGLVFFGFHLTGSAMWVLGPALGIYMLVWVAGLWGLRGWAVPMGAAYALVRVRRAGARALAPGAPQGVGCAPCHIA